MTAPDAVWLEELGQDFESWWHLTMLSRIRGKDIAAKDAEKARAEVQAAAAAKAAEKLRKEGVKGEAERQRLAAELDGLKTKFQVLRRLQSCTNSLCRPTTFHLCNRCRAAVVRCSGLIKSILKPAVGLYAI